VLDQGAPSVGRHFSRKFSCAFRLRKLSPKSAARVLPAFGLRHFTRGFSRKIIFLTCPCAFRLRRLAQKMGLSLGVRHFTREFSCKMALVTCPCAFRLRKLAHNVSLSLGVCLLPENSRIKLLV
jgi:hypothetical protein